MPPLDQYRSFFLAKLTAKTTVGSLRHYTWVEQTHNPLTGAPINANPGRSGTATVSPALEANNADIDLTNPVYVEMRAKGVVKGQVYYEFAYEPGGVAGVGDVIGPDCAPTGELAVFTDPSGRFIGPARNRSAEAALPSQFAITADDVWQDVTGWSLTIPETGRYLLWATVIASAQVSVLGGGAVAGVAFLMRYSDPVQYPSPISIGPGGVVALAPVTGVTFDGTTTSVRNTAPFTLNKGGTLTMQARRVTQGGTFSVSTINTSWRSLTGGSRMGFVRM